MDHQPVQGKKTAPRWPLERATVLALWITCIVMLPVLALVFYVVRRSKPGRFRLTVKLLKLVDIGIEVDADRRDELPGPRSLLAPCDEPSSSTGAEPSGVPAPPRWSCAIPGSVPTSCRAIGSVGWQPLGRRTGDLASGDPGDGKCADAKVDCLADPALPWTGQVAALAHRLRTVLEDHSGIAALLKTRDPIGPASLAWSATSGITGAASAESA